MAAVSWRYPREGLISLTKSLVAKAKPASFTGSNTAVPSRAIPIGLSVDQGEAPPLFVVSSEGETQLVNYRVKGRYYVVDRLFARAELRLGEKDQQVVRIDRTQS